MMNAGRIMFRLDEYECYNLACPLKHLTLQNHDKYIAIFVDRLGNDSVEKLALVSDLEEIITFYSKTTKIPFRADNGWTDLLQLLSVLKLPKPQLYNCFHALVNRYIPK